EAENLEKKPKDFVYDKLSKCKALLHLKQGDQPGVAVMEAMIFSKPIVTVKPFVWTSFNADIVIDGYNSLVSESLPELIERVKNTSEDEFKRLGQNAKVHIEMMSSFDRQKHSLNRFIERCFK